MMMRWLAFLTALVAAAVIGHGAAQPQRVVVATAPAAVFSAERAMVDVREIARAPHVTGSAENARVRGVLVARLAALGFDVRTSAHPLGERARKRLTEWGDAAADTRQAVNIIGVRGDTGAPLVLLMAHYDSVKGSPGAPDDAAGVAAALEMARALADTPGQRRGLAILFTDAEELGLDGASAFFTHDPLARRVGVIVNLEARGGGGRAMMFETGRNNGAMIDLLRRHVRMPSANSAAVTAYEKLPNKTDYTIAKERGIPGFNFAFVGNAGLYHSPLATPEALDARSVQDMGAQALDLTRALLTVEALPAPAPDAVFSDVLGGFIIAYPAWVGWLLLGIVAALIGFAAWRRRGGWRWSDVAIGAGAVQAFAIVAAALIYTVNLLSLAAGKPNYYDRLAALPRIEAFTLAAVLAALALVMAAVRNHRDSPGAWIGAALFNLLLAAAVQLLVPGVTPLFTWPLLLAALTLALAALHRGSGMLAAIAAAAIGLALLGGTGHFVLLALGDTMPALVALLLPMVLLLLWPLLPPVSWRGGGRAALLLIAVAVGLALWVRLDPVAPSVAVYSISG